MEKIKFLPSTDSDKTRVPHAEVLLDMPDLHPQPARKFIPEWFEKLSAYQMHNADGVKPGDHIALKRIEFESATIKACRPVQEFLNLGYVIPLWSEHAFKRDTMAGFFYSATKWGVDGHMGDQLGDALKTTNMFQMGNVAKFMNPWQVVTPPGYSCLFIKPFYHFEDRFEIMPAIVNTDKFDSTVNFPALIRSENCGDGFVIEMGYPLVQVIPFKRTDWKSMIERFSDELTKKSEIFRYRMKNTLNLVYHKLCKAETKFK